MRHVLSLSMAIIIYLNFKFRHSLKLSYHCWWYRATVVYVIPEIFLLTMATQLVYLRFATAGITYLLKTILMIDLSINF